MRKISVEESAARLREKDDILILMHAHPDGDTLGCGFALTLALRQLGKRVRAICADPILPKFTDLIEGATDMPEFEERYIVAVDVATEHLLGDIADSFSGKINMCIDHHGSNTEYADELLLDAGAASACEIVLRVIKALGVQITQPIANALFMGISTDTGCFRYASVSAHTFRAAAELVELGAQNARINRAMFESKSRCYVALEHLVMEGAEFYAGGKICIATITQAMYAKTGSTEADSEAITALPRQIEGVEVGLTLIEKEDGTSKCSVRTLDAVSAAQLAKHFGGGGHPQAAACRFECGVDEAKQQLIAYASSLLDAAE